MARRYVSNSEGEPEDLGRRLGRRLGPGAVVAYTGDLGAGKTASPGVWPGDWISASG